MKTSELLQAEISLFINSDLTSLFKRTETLLMTHKVASSPMFLPIIIPINKSTFSLQKLIA